MRIEGVYKKVGDFWLPNKPEIKIPGILNISNGGKIELEIFGQFDENLKIPGILNISNGGKIEREIFGQFDENFINENTLINRIIGQVEGDGFVTLENCWYTHYSSPIFTGITTKSKVHVTMVLSGAQYFLNESITFNTLSFSMDCFDDWVGITCIKSQIVEESYTITATRPSNITVNLDKGIKLEICFNLPISVSSAYKIESIIRQNAYFKLTSEVLLPLDNFLEIVRKLTHFMHFAIDTTIALKNLRATSSEMESEIEGKKYTQNISIYCRTNQVLEEVPNQHFSSMLFNYRSIEHIAQQAFNNWINAYDIIEPTLNLYFSTKFGPTQYLVESKLLGLVQGLESYHRRKHGKKDMESSEEFQNILSKIEQLHPEDLKWFKDREKFFNQINLRKRLKEMIKSFDGVSAFKDNFGNSKSRDDFVNDICDYRNYFTHYSQESEKPVKDIQKDIQKLLNLCNKMEVIFQLLFLRLLGFDDEAISRLIEKRVR